LHANVHADWTQTGCALATFVVQALPQTSQWLTSLVVSTHVPEHRVVPCGQFETHA
jgi:hypothetical protein